MLFSCTKNNASERKLDFFNGKNLKNIFFYLSLQ